MPRSFKLLLLRLGRTCNAAADKLRYIFSDSQCLRAFNQGFPLFFFWLFLLQKKRKSADINEKYRWKLHGEIQRHAIEITFMFMTNDRCEDSFV